MKRHWNLIALVLTLFMLACLAGCRERGGASQPTAGETNGHPDTPPGSGVRTELVLEVTETPLLAKLLSGGDRDVRTKMALSAAFTVSKSGSLYVLGAHGDAVYCFRNNHLVRTLPVRGGEARAASVSSVDVDGKGRLYCWDKGSRRVVILQESGAVLCSTRIAGLPKGYAPEVAVTDAGVLRVGGAHGYSSSWASGSRCVRASSRIWPNTPKDSNACRSPTMGTCTTQSTSRHSPIRGPRAWAGRMSASLFSRVTCGESPPTKCPSSHGTGIRGCVRRTAPWAPTTWGLSMALHGNQWRRGLDGC